MNNLLKAADVLNSRIHDMRFAEPVTHVYNPSFYARGNYAEYVRRYGQSPKRVLFLGMNPGPYGMVQSGIPFGDVRTVGQWLNIDTPIKRPAVEHVKRPVVGLECTRIEKSGERLWGAIREHFGTPERFFFGHFVENYCPLAFMEASGRNRTPDKLMIKERIRLFQACDDRLRAIVDFLNPAFVVGIGVFAERRAKDALADYSITVGRILHPSPANPRANTKWREIAFQELSQLLGCGDA